MSSRSDSFPFLQQEEVPPAPIRTQVRAPAPADLPARPPLTTGEAFDLLKATDHALVEKYKPTYLAKGGEHVVYEIPGKPNLVVKADTEPIRRVQYENDKAGTPLDTLTPAQLEGMTDLLQEDKDRYRALTDHFGRTHVLGMRQAILNVPMTPDFITQIHGRELARAKDTHAAWAIVKVQERAHEIGDARTREWSAGYAEAFVSDPDAYARTTRALLENDASVSYNEDEFRIMLPERARYVFSEVAFDPELLEAMRDFVNRAMDYTIATGEILDLAGSNNVTVFPEGNDWNYHLVDALDPSGKDTIRLATSAAEKAARGEALTQDEKIGFLNAVNYFRAINGLARHVGITDWITFVPDELFGKIDYLAVLAPMFRQKKTA